MKYIVGILFFGLFSISLFGQVDNRPSIKTVKLESDFIDAKREVLLDNLEDAITIYEGILLKDVNNATAYYEMAKVYEKLKKPTEARTNAKEAFVLENNNEWYGVYYVDFLVDDGAYQDAARVYESIIAANPKHAPYYYERAYLLTKAKEFDKAIQVYDALEAQAGISERTARHKHTIYNLMGKKTEAAAALESLISTFPTESQYYHVLAQYYDQQGKAGKAKEVYKRALKMNPEDPVSSIALAENMKAAGDEAQYLLSLKPLFNRDEVSIDIKVKELYPYINKLPNVKDDVTDVLLDLSKTITTVHPENPKAYAIYADILYYSGSPREALTQYNNTLALDNSVFSVWEQILLINEELGQTDELLKASENALDLFPNHAFIYYMNGLAYNRKQSFDDAIDALEQAIMMSGRDNVMKAKIHAALGVSYYGTKDYSDSDDNFDKALELDGKNIEVLNNYSYFLAVQNKDLDKALSMIKSANSIAPNKPSLEDTYGLIYYKKKKYKDAEKWFKKALDNGGDNNTVILEHYGDVMFKLNQADVAVEYWQKAKKLGSNSKFLEKKIADRKLYE